MMMMMLRGGCATTTPTTTCCKVVKKVVLLLVLVPMMMTKGFGFGEEEAVKKATPLTDDSRGNNNNNNNNNNFLHRSPSLLLVGDSMVVEDTRQGLFRRRALMKKKMKKKKIRVGTTPSSPCPSLNQVYDVSKNKCVNGLEAGQPCQSSSACFSASCNSASKNCVCLTMAACDGCNRPDAACLRLEQPLLSRQPFEVCSLAAILRGTNNTKIALFSGGVSYTANYTALQWLVQPGSTTVTRKCVVAQFRDPQKPPSYVQANVKVTDPDTMIRQVRVEVKALNPVSAIDGIFFLKGQWVKNLRWTDNNKGDSVQGYNSYAVDVWPRVVVPSIATAKMWLLTSGGASSFQGRTIVVMLNDTSSTTNVWDVSIPVGVGLEIVGVVGVGGGTTTTRPTIRIQGNLNLLGRLSFKNMDVSFDNGDGSINVQAPLIFQQSRILDTAQCPPRFTEINGLCLFLSEQVDTGDDASATCTLYDRAFLPMFSDLVNATAVASELLPPGQSVWIKSSSSSSFFFGGGGASLCPALTSEGTLDNSISNCAAAFKPTLCAARVKDPLPGQNWTNYFSDYLAPDLYHLFLRLDKGNLIQVGGTLSVYQMDLLDTGQNATLLTVTDSKPTGLSVAVKLAIGSLSQVQVAVDTADFPKGLNSTGFAFYNYTKDLLSTLPSRIQVHAGAPVCVTQVDLYLRNESGRSHLVFSLPASALAECEGLNVCSVDDESSCSQSLMYYDKLNKCAVLEPNKKTVPRDLTLKLFTSACSRLTTWNHPRLGESMMLEVDYNFTPQVPIEVNARASIYHKYSFAAHEGFQQVLSECTRVPLEFTLTGGTGARVTAIRITRYGLDLAAVQFSNLWNCIHVCDAVADSTGLKMSMNETTLAYISLVDSLECQKLETLFTYSNSENDTITTSTEACSTPAMTLLDLDSIKQELVNLLSPDQPYRTLKVSITSKARYREIATVDIAANRGLAMEAESDVDTMATTIGGVHFTMNQLSELSLDGVTLTGFTKIDIPKSATVNIAGCTIKKQQDSVEDITFLSNEGTAYLANTKVMLDSKLINLAGGTLKLAYVEFTESAEVITDSRNDTELVVSRLQLYDTFDLPSSVTLPDARRSYTIVDENETLCSGSDDGTALVATYDLGTFDCETLCEELDLCSGFMSYTINNADDEPQCDVCLKDNKACSLNCSKSVASLYQKAESHFDYLKVTACPFLERNLRKFDGESLEECKMLCSYYKSCEGFEYASGSGETPSSCKLIASLDLFTDVSCTNQSRPMYLPYIADHMEGFVEVPGNLLPAAPLAVHLDLGSDECATVCKKTIECSSFISETQGSVPVCKLFNDNRFIRSTNWTGLFIDVSDIFPKNRYMKVKSCFSSSSSFLSSFNAKTEDHCQVLCGQDLSCAAFKFDPFTSHFVDNCFLYSRNSVIDGLFNPDATCARLEVEIIVTYAVETYEPISGRSFVPFLTASGDLLVDECKSLCLYEVGCVAFIHTASTFECVLGDLADGESNTTYSALTAASADAKSNYLSNVMCYSGEDIKPVEPDFVEETRGFVRWPRTCPGDSADVGLVTPVLSPAECGLLCSLTAECVGFNYYVNYGGSSNADKIGRCELLGGSVVFDDCDAVDLNVDMYLRPKDFSACEALCNVHQLCSAFVMDDYVGCLLFSDIALGECNASATPRLVHVSLSYLERDAMVAVPGQCFVEFEDTSEIDCFDSTIENLEYMGLGNLVLPNSSLSTIMTPYLCQQLCLENRTKYYAVANGDNCLCSDIKFYTELVTSTNCTTPCAGDSSQYCGGGEAVLVGSTNLPLQDITLSECKKTCFESSSCRGLMFRDTGTDTSCELRSSALFDACSPAPGDAYIESIEHYYATPKTSYLGDTVLFISTTITTSECEVLCDYFSTCHAVSFNAALAVNNCALLGGSKVTINSTAEGIVAALDVNLFTIGWSPDETARIVKLSRVFDEDECRALCEEHARCGAFMFKAKECTLYKAKTFAVANETLPVSTPYFVSYHAFVDPDQKFVEAEDLCVEESSKVLESRSTTRSDYDCASRCNRNPQCTVFTYDKQNQKNCVLYGSDTKLVISVSGGNCPNSATPYVMYTPAMFTLQNNTCLKNEGLGEFVFTNKQLEECAALCDQWFNCRSFRFEDSSGDCRLFTSEQYSASACGGNEQPGDLYVYYSDFYYVELGGDFCVSANSFISEVPGTPLEACKTICDLLENCVALSHSQHGLCSPYSSSDLSVPCTPNPDRSLFISTRDVVDKSRPQYTYILLSNCFEATADTTLANFQSDCEDMCSQNPDCFGYQYAPLSRKCDVLNGTLPSRVSCLSNITAYLRTDTYPYKTEANTCLRNPISFGSPQARILDVEEYECVAVCEAHYACRYLLYGSTSTGTNPELRECILFAAQKEVLTNCKNYNGPYTKRTALVNGRTFLDINTWFGEPETMFATISGITYQECASLCDQLGGACEAFVHTWNYRRASTATTPELFTKSRIIHSNFGPGNDKALFLQFDLTDSQFVVAEAFSDDDVKAQSLFFEQVGDDGVHPSFAFRTRSGFCVAGSSFAFLPNGNTLDIIHRNFGIEANPVCQTLDVMPCSDPQVLRFTFGEQGGVQVLNATYSASNTSFVGCLSVVPMTSSQDNKDFVLTGDKFGDLVIPAEVTENITSSSFNCSTAQSRLSVKYPNASTWTQYNWTQNTVSGPHPCSGMLITVPYCNFSDTVAVTNDTVTNTTICQYPPSEQCSSPVNQSTVFAENYTIVMGYVIPANSTYTIQNRTCSYSSPVNKTVRTYTQRTAGYLLNEMYGFFSSACNKTGSQSTRVFSRSYASGCGFDDKVASFPYQLFDYASDEVEMYHESTKLCLSKSMSLVPCAGNSPTTWIYTFTGGLLFHVDAVTRSMKCLSRMVNSEQLSVDVCNSTATELQVWNYIPWNGTLSVPGDSSKCLAVVELIGQLGSCAEPSARWLQYSECRLNTYSNTDPMKLESFDNPDKCMSSNGTQLNACHGSDVGTWQYYYDATNGNLGHLERLFPTWSPPQCFGRVPHDINNPYVSIPEESPNGIIPCDTTLSEDPLQVFYRTTLYGDEYNVFSFLANNKDYCVRLPNTSPPQTLCGSGSEQKWRAYGSSGDSTELSLKPGAASQEITNFEVALQFFLFSSEGKVSRILRANTAKLRRLVDTILPAIDQAALTVSTVSDLIQSVEDPATELMEKLNTAERIFKVFAVVLKPVESVPYVGPVVKSTGLSKLSDQISKRTKDGSAAIDKATKTLNTTYAPIDVYGTALVSLASNMDIGMAAIEQVVDYVTRMHFCAYRDGLLDEYQRMLSWINTLSSSVNVAISFVSSLADYLGVMDKLQYNINFGVFAAFREFSSLIEGIFKVTDFLSFLNFLGDFRLCIPKVYIGTCTIDLLLGKISFPCPKLQSKFCVGLDWIGDLLQSIENVIRSIPLVGAIWDFILGLAESAMRSFFRTIGMEIPDFGLELPFVNELIKAVDDAKDFFRNTINQFQDLVLIGGDLFDRVQEGVDNLLNDSFPSGWFDLLDCENQTCFADVLNVDFIDDVIPGVVIDGINYTVADELVSTVQDMISDLGDVFDDVSDLFNGEIACREYKSFEVDYAEIVANTFGKTAAQLGLPNCPSTWQMCVDIQLSSLETFQTRMTQKLEFWGLIGTGGRQLVECPAHGGVSIPLSLPSALASFLFKVVRDKSNNVLSEQQKSELQQLEAKAKLLVEASQGRLVSWASKFWTQVTGVASRLPLLEKLMKTKKPPQVEFSISEKAMPAAASASMVIGCDAQGKFTAKLQVLPFLIFGFDINLFGWFQTSLGKKHFTPTATNTLTAQSRALAKANEYACILDAIEATAVVAAFGPDFQKFLSLNPQINEFLAALDADGVSTEILDRADDGRKEWLLRTAGILETKAKNDPDPKLSNHEAFVNAHKSALELRAKMHVVWEDVEPEYRHALTTVDFEADDCAGPAQKPQNIILSRDDLKKYVNSFLDDFAFHPTDASILVGANGLLPRISLRRTMINAKGIKKDTSLIIQYRLFNHLRCLAQGNAKEFDVSKVRFDVVALFKFFKGVYDSFKPNPYLLSNAASSLFKAVSDSVPATEEAPLAQQLAFKVDWLFGFLSINVLGTEENACVEAGCCFADTFCIGLGPALDGFQKLRCQGE